MVDGDSIRVRRSREFECDGKRWRLHDVQPVAIRLVHVDTPERNEPGWGEARADLTDWIGLVPRAGMRLVCFYPDNFGRLLGDLIDADGQSCSQWMLRERGWPYYRRGN